MNLSDICNPNGVKSRTRECMDGEGVVLDIEDCGSSIAEQTLSCWDVSAATEGEIIHLL